VSRPDQPDLTPKQIEDAIKMVGEGHRLATIAKKFRVTRQAFYMRKARSEGQPDGFAEKVASAEADAEMRFLMLLIMAERDWQKFAWILERRFGWLSAMDRAKVNDLRKSKDGEQDRARALREFMEAAILAAEGDDAAPLGAAAEPDLEGA
jgi:hypothetical protein